MVGNPFWPLFVFFSQVRENDSIPDRLMTGQSALALAFPYLLLLCQENNRNMVVFLHIIQP